MEPKFDQTQVGAFRAALEAVQAQQSKRILEEQAARSEELVSSIKRLAETDIPEIAISEEVRKACESLDFNSSKFSFKELRRFAVKQYRALNEANAPQAFGQLFRVGVQTIANAWYLRRPVSWPQYMQEYASRNRQEFHAPLFGSALPTLTGPGEPYSESRVIGQDIEVINHKFMGGESFDRELFDDDQTGQIRVRAQHLGEAQKALEEVYAAQRVTGVAGTIANVKVAASRYKTQNADGAAISTVFSDTIYSTALGGNRKPNGAFHQLDVPSIKAARAQLLNAVDPNNVRLLSDPRTLLISPMDVDVAAILAHSAYYPAVQGLAGTTASTAASGALAAPFAQNPFVGMLNPVVNVYLAPWSWYLGDSSKGMVFQRRDPMEVVQEVPNSGNSFNFDTIRFRSRARWEQEWLEARFWFQGNDGSVTGSF